MLDVPLPDETYVLIDRFIAMMQQCTQALENRSEIISDVADSLGGIHGRMESAINDVVSITEIVAEQNKSAEIFLGGIDGLTKSYEELSLDCYDTGRHLYRISRDVDNARNDIFRNNSKPTIHDTLRVYEVDHLTLTWRIYNHLMEIETLKITQVNNPDRCKFGIWRSAQMDASVAYGENSDADVARSPAFAHALEAHERLHKHAVASFMAKEDFDMPYALKEFEKTLESFEAFREGLEELHEWYIKQGQLDETPIWKFQ